MVKEINVTKLHHELVEAGIPIDGCSSDGRIDYKEEVTEDQKDQAQIILNKHKPIWYIQERRKEYVSRSSQAAGNDKERYKSWIKQ